MLYPFIEVERAERRNVKRACKLLEVSRAAFYDWVRHIPSVRKRADAQLLEKIETVHEDSKGTYGSPRVHAQLQIDGETCGENRVARLMQANSIVGRRKRRFKKTTIPDPAGATTAVDLVKRLFGPGTVEVNRLWCGDISFIRTWEGWLYLATVIDVASRRVVGWAMCDHMRTELVNDALQMALDQRRPSPGLIFHSDRGCQGGFTWSSQHLRDGGVSRWVPASASRRSGRCAVTCGRLVGPRRLDERIEFVSGKRSLAAHRAKRPRSMPGCRQRWGLDGSARLVGCHRSSKPSSHADTCRSPKERRLRSFMPKA